VDKKQLTQVGRALKQLGIRHIPSYTPKGRGRMSGCLARCSNGFRLCYAGLAF
jgi:hypothetical protein